MRKPKTISWEELWRKIQKMSYNDVKKYLKLNFKIKAPKDENKAKKLLYDMIYKAFGGTRSGIICELAPNCPCYLSCLTGDCCLG